MAEKISNVKAIRLYFEKDGIKIPMNELKELTLEDREELGELARKELNLK